MRNTQMDHRLLSCVVMVSCLFVWACGERPMGPKEEQAIQTVKAYQQGDDFSVVSNVEKHGQDAGHAGNAWTTKSWEAGLLSQQDRIYDELSQYFNIFEAPGGRWVRFSYTDNDGVHEALWEIDLYKKSVEPKNDAAKELMTSPAS